MRVALQLQLDLQIKNRFVIIMSQLRGYNVFIYTDTYICLAWPYPVSDSCAELNYVKLSGLLDIFWNIQLDYFVIRWEQLFDTTKEKSSWKNRNIT